MMQYVLISLLLLASANSLADTKAHKKGFDLSSLGCELTEIKQPISSALSINAKTDRSEYRVDDSLILEITPSEEAYVSVIDQGSNGKMDKGQLLFSDHFVAAEQVFIFPPPNMGTLQVSEPIGTNTFEIIASSFPYAQMSSLDNVDEGQDAKANGRDVNFLETKYEKNTGKITRCTIRFEVTSKDK